MRPEIAFWPGDLWPWPSKSTFDLDPCDLWPWPMWPLTSKITCKVVKWVLKIMVFLLCDLDLWPMTLTLTVNFRVIHVHVLTKFHDPRSNDCWDMNFFLVTFCLVTCRWTDRTRHIRAHCAGAQVGSKNVLQYVNRKYYIQQIYYISSVRNLWYLIYNIYSVALCDVLVRKKSVIFYLENLYRPTLLVINRMSLYTRKYSTLHL